SVQNLAWGVLQPVVGALAVRFGFRPILLAGALAYACGLGLLASAQGVVGVVISAGVIIGAALACCASAMAQATASRAAPPAQRSVILGIVTALGSLGALVAAPLAQTVTSALGWRFGILALLALALLVLPAAWLAGGADRIPVARASGSDIGDDVTVRAAL